MRLLERLNPRRSMHPAMSLQDLAEAFSFNGSSYLAGLIGQTFQSDREEIPAGFAGYAQHGYAGNSVVFAVSMARMLLFSEARFQYQRFEQGRPGELFGTPALQILETPDWNMSTGDLLARMDQDVTISGNWFGTTVPGGPTGRRVRRLQPDWVTLILGSQRHPEDPSWQVDAEVLGYLYTPGGPAAGNEPEVLLREEVAHYCPYPDPLAQFRGMSWMTPLLPEVDADSSATRHKLKFFQNGATPNLVVMPDASVTPEQFKKAVDDFRLKHEGAQNAYRTLFLAGGTDVKTVGTDLKQLDFKVTQGAGETRICAAAGVPPVIVGLSEGLQAATYSNYQQARRKFGDHWAWPHWRRAAKALEPLAPPPTGASLAVDDRHIPFLRDDEQDLADIRNKDAQTLRALLDAGYDPDAAIEFVRTGDLTKLTGKHSGLFSVQLQPPATDEPDEDPAADGEQDPGADGDPSSDDSGDQADDEEQ